MRRREKQRTASLAVLVEVFSKIAFCILYGRCIRMKCLFIKMEQRKRFYHKCLREYRRTKKGILVENEYCGKYACKRRSCSSSKNIVQSLRRRALQTMVLRWWLHPFFPMEIKYCLSILEVQKPRIGFIDAIFSCISRG